MASDGPGDLTAVALVGVGGFVGSVLRYVVTVFAPTAAIGTLAVNVLGSFLLGLLLTESNVRERLSARSRLVLATGLLSSFTTYSTFALETAGLAPTWALGYVAANYGLAILAVVLAALLARWAR